MTPELITMLMSAGLGAFLKMWQKSMEQKELTQRLLSGERQSIDESMDKASKRGDKTFKNMWQHFMPQTLVRPVVTLVAMAAFFYPVFAGVPAWIETCQLGGFWSFLPWVETQEHCKFEALSPGGITILKEHKQVALAIVGFWFGNRAVK